MSPEAERGAEATLGEWLSHHGGCPIECPWEPPECYLHDSHACTCGLDAALASVSAPRGLTQEEQDAYDWVIKRHEGCVECDEFCLPDHELLAAIDRLSALPDSERPEKEAKVGDGVPRGGPLNAARPEENPDD